MTEDQRQEWNAAVQAVNDHPGSAVAVAERDRLRAVILTRIGLKIMTEDDYQARTHAKSDTPEGGVASPADGHGVR